MDKISIKGVIKATLIIRSKDKNIKTEELLIQSLKDDLHLDSKTIIDVIEENVSIIDSDKNVNSIFPFDEEKNGTKPPFAVFSTEKDDKIFLYRNGPSNNSFIVYFIISSKILLTDISSDLLECLKKKLTNYEITLNPSQDIYGFLSNKDNDLTLYKQELNYLKQKTWHEFWDKSYNKFICGSSVVLLCIIIYLVLGAPVDFSILTLSRSDCLNLVIPLFLAGIGSIVSWVLNAPKDSFVVDRLLVHLVTERQLTRKEEKVEDELKELESEELNPPNRGVK